MFVPSRLFASDGLLRSQDGPKTAQKKPQDAPKKPPRGFKNTSKKPPSAQLAQDGPTSLPEAPSPPPWPFLFRSRGSAKKSGRSGALSNDEELRDARKDPPPDR